MSFARLWETWTSLESAQIESCTILTTAANDVIRPLHDRMPVMLTADRFETWLDPATAPAHLVGAFAPPPRRVRTPACQLAREQPEERGSQARGARALAGHPLGFCQVVRCGHHWHRVSIRLLRSLPSGADAVAA
jgi:SOS response associated peptidase (SRAP)